MAKLFGIGVGPGDSELLTLKAVRTIKNCRVIVAPSAMKGGKSIALDTAKEFIEAGTEILVLHFPMGGEEQEGKIVEAFKRIEEKLEEGLDVGFLTIGDPFLYSTYIYLLKYAAQKGYEIETIPGITSFCACASLANEPLVIGNEPLLIVPGDRLDAVRDEKFIVIMKVYKLEKQILDFLDQAGFTYVYVKKAGREGQAILRDRKEILEQKEYMSIIIAHRE